MPLVFKVQKHEAHLPLCSDRWRSDGKHAGKEMRRRLRWGFVDAFSAWVCITRAYLLHPSCGFNLLPLHVLNYRMSCWSFIPQVIFNSPKYIKWIKYNSLLPSFSRLTLQVIHVIFSVTLKIACKYWITESSRQAFNYSFWLCKLSLAFPVEAVGCSLDHKRIANIRVNGNRACLLSCESANFKPTSLLRAS